MTHDPILDEEEIDEEEIDSLELIILDEKPIRKRKPKDPKEYVNKEEMWQEIYNYYMSLEDSYDWTTQKIKVKNQLFPKITEKLSKMIDDIVVKMGYRPNFIQYSYLDEMRGDARTKMFKALRDCSFKCFTTSKIIKEEQTDNGVVLYFLDKKGKEQSKLLEDTDKFQWINSVKWVTFRANAFGYYSRITSHAFINRIKKEQDINETKEAYQAETWEKMLATENFQGVRRPKIMSDYDENDAVFASE